MKFRIKQCKACPWRKDVTASEDIPNGYCERKHAALEATIAEPSALSISDTLRMMACHESLVGAEVPCVGWLAHQLGPGNNIALRLWVRSDPEFRKAVSEMELVGEQHECFEDTIT